MPCTPPSRSPPSLSHGKGFILFIGQRASTPVFKEVRWKTFPHDPNTPPSRSSPSIPNGLGSPPPFGKGRVYGLCLGFKMEDFILWPTLLNLLVGVLPHFPMQKASCIFIGKGFRLWI